MTTGIVLLAATALMAAATFAVWRDERHRASVRHARPAPWRRTATAATGWARAHHTQPLAGLPAMDGDYDTTTIALFHEWNEDPGRPDEYVPAALPSLYPPPPRPQLAGILHITPGQLTTTIAAVRAFAMQVEVAATRPWAHETSWFAAIDTECAA